MIPSFEELVSAEFGFEEMKALFFKVYTYPAVDSVMEKVRAFIGGLSPIVLAAVLALIGLCFAFFGKRFMLIPTVLVGVAAVGFAGGYVFVAPRIDAFIGGFIPISPLVVGTVVAVIAGVLFIPIYYLGLAASCTYITYLLTFPITTSMLGESLGMTVGLCIGIGVAFLVLILRKWVEMGATALLGGYLIMLGANCIVLLPAAVNYMLWGAFAVAGFVVQARVRKNYYIHIDF